MDVSDECDLTFLWFEFDFLGLVGEYIGRIFLEVNNTPQYVIKEIIMNGSEIQVSKNIDNEGGA